MRRLAAVDEHKPWTVREARHGLRHGPQRGVEDVVGIDAIDAGDADADLRRGEDGLIDGLARLGVKRLAIGDALRNERGIEHHGSCNHRTGQRAAPRFVDAGDWPAAQLELDSLQLEGRLHSANHPALSAEASRYRGPLSKELELAALRDRRLEEIGAQFGGPRVEP